jgi:hypothetical protein
VVRSWARRQVALAALYIVAVSCEPFKDEYAKFRSIQKGMTEAEVIQRLGTPDRVYTKDNAPKNYYVEGWTHEEREIRGKVLIYIGSEPIAYIYLDPQGVVEHVFVGGS